MTRYLIVKNCLEARTKLKKRKCPFLHMYDGHEDHWCNFDEDLDRYVENPNTIPEWCPLFSFKQIVDKIKNDAIKEELKTGQEIF